MARYAPRRLLKNAFRSNRKLRQMYEALFPETSDRMWAIRESLNMTQRQLAEECELSSSAISRMECGYGLPKGTTIIKLASGVGVSADYLLNISDQREIAGLPTKRKRA